LKIVVLSTNTIHHRFFIDSINSFRKVDSVFLEKEIIQPNFDNSSPFKDKESYFENENFKFHDGYPNCPLYEFKTMNDRNSIDKIREIKPDIGIVFGTGKLCSEIIDSFPLLMNVHRGIPQYYRGLDSDLWAINNNDYKNIGTTIHEVEVELDTGRIIGQEPLIIFKDMKIHQIRYYTTILAINLCLEAIDNFSKGKLKLIPQNKKGRYFSFMNSQLKRKMEYQFNTHCSNL
jgi:methionyl-tRNA formyltransferase